MADKGDVHFEITADDKASAVIASFTREAQTLSQQAVDRISSVFESFNVDMSQWSSGISRALGVIANPTPWNILSTGLRGAADAWSYLSEQQDVANQKQIAWNNSAEAFQQYRKQIESVRESTQDLGLTDKEAAVSRFKRGVDSMTTTPQESETIDRLKEERRQAEISLGNASSGSRVEEFSKRRIAEVEQELRDFEEARRLRKSLYVREYEAAVDEQNAPKAEKRYVDLMNYLEVSDRDKKLEAIRKLRHEARQATINAERQFISKWFEMEDADRKASVEFREGAKRKGESLRKSLRDQLETPEQKLDRRLLELDLMQFFGAIDPAERKKLEDKARGPSATPNRSSPPGYTPNSPIESRTLNRGPGSSFNPEGILKRSADSSERTAKETEKQSGLIDRQTKAAERLAATFSSLVVVG